MIRKASALAPDDASITDQPRLGAVKRGRLPEAIATLQRAAATDPTQAEIHEHLGDALYAAGPALRGALRLERGADQRRGRCRQAAQGQARGRPDPGQRSALSACSRETRLAKLNLALHVRGRLPDGRHAIETIFAFCDDGDELTRRAADDLSLTIERPVRRRSLPTSSRQSRRRRRHGRLREAAGVEQGAALHLDKRLAGRLGAWRRFGRCGGGAAPADALVGASTRALRTRLRRGSARTSRLPAFAELPRAKGRATSSSRVDLGLAGTPVLLVNPRVPLSTGAVFAAWDGVDRGPLGDWREGRNDLEAAGDRAGSGNRRRARLAARRSPARTSSACRGRARPASPCSTSVAARDAAASACPAALVASGDPLALRAAHDPPDPDRRSHARRRAGGDRRRHVGRDADGAGRGRPWPKRRGASPGRCRR